MTNQTMNSETMTLSNDDFFPKKIPLILMAPDNLINFICMVLGILFGFSSSFLISTNMEEGSILASMFNQESLQTLIPTFISCMFFWGLIICIARWFIIDALEKISKINLLLSVNMVLDDGKTENLKSYLDEKICDYSPLLRRIKSVFRQWLIHPGLQEAEIILDRHISYDVDTTHINYSLVRIFVWALPVLGLIGTVLGISESVGDFSKFLGGNVEDVAAIKKNLVGVTAGLSFAFLITLQGLLTSLITMLIVSFLQNREEKFFSNIQNNLIELFIPSLQRIIPEYLPHNKNDAEIEIFKNNLERISVDVISVIKTTGERVIQSIDTNQETATNNIQIHTKIAVNEVCKVSKEAIEQIGVLAKKKDDQWQTELQYRQDSMTNWAKSLLHETSENINSQYIVLSDAVGTISNVSEKWIACIESLNFILADLSKVQSDNNEVLQKNYFTMQTSISEYQQTFEILSTSINDTMDKASSGVVYKLESMQMAINQLEALKLEQVLSLLVESLSSQTNDLKSTTVAIGDLTELSVKVIDAQTRLHQAMDQMNDSGFLETLQKLTRSFDLLVPVLDGFRKPFVFQAVNIDDYPKI